MRCRAGAQANSEWPNVQTSKLSGNLDHGRHQCLHLVAISVSWHANVADPDLQTVPIKIPRLQAFVRNRHVPSHVCQRFPERGGRGLYVVEQPQLTWIKRPGEMKAEERIAYRLRSECEKSDLALNSDPRCCVLNLLDAQTCSSQERFKLAGLLYMQCGEARDPAVGTRRQR